MKKALVSLLCLCMLFCMLGMTVSAAAEVGTPVEDFEPGDYGTMVLKSGYARFYETPSSSNAYKYATGDNITIEVVEAYVLQDNSKGHFHAVKYKGEVLYLIASFPGLEFGDYIKLGNNPDRPYAAGVNSQPTKKDDKPIASITPHYIYVKEGEQPKMAGGQTSTYTLDVTSISSDPSKPYTWETVESYYRAKDGYFFEKNVKLSGMTKATYVEIKYVDKKTVKATFTRYVTSTTDKTVTDSMKIYGERNKEAYSATPYVATAVIYDPTYGDNTAWAEHPTLREYPSRASRNLKSTSARKGAKVEILDMDLREYIPEMVGEWYFVRLGHADIGFIEKGYLTDITPVNYWEGAPGNSTKSPFRFEGGTGTVKDPYLVATPDQLNAIRLDMDAHYKLIADIDLSDWGNWVPIGGTPAYGGHHGDSVNVAQHGSCVFIGSIDGNGHKISGMTIKIYEDKPYKFEKGNSRFYSFIAEASSDNHMSRSEKSGVYNLGLVDYTIDIHYKDLTGAATNSNTFWIAPLVANGMNFDIMDCYSANGTVKLTVDRSENLYLTIGGLVAESSDSEITRCYNTGDTKVVIDTPIDNYMQGGGLAGIIIRTNITECYNTGDMLLPTFEDFADTYYDEFFEMELPFEPWWQDCFVGGLVGYALCHDSPGVTIPYYITDCYNTGNLSAIATEGLLVSTASNTYYYMTNCYNVGQMQYNPKEEANTSILTLSPGATRTNCFNNGNSVSGSAWQYSSTLGRKVLKSIPEDAISVPTVTPTPTPSPVSPTPPVTPAPSDSPFVDVVSSDWFYAPVMWAVENNITGGIGNNCFGPDNTCVRGQVVTFMWAAAGKPEPKTTVNPFVDVYETDYYYKAVLWAVENNITGGIGNDCFGPLNPCTRNQVVTFLYAAAGKPEIKADQSDFADVATTDWFCKPVMWAVENGITSGIGEGCFGPENPCTRSHIVTFLYKANQ